jgi:hypothetical protein
MTRTALARPSRRARAWLLTLLGCAAALSAVPGGPGAAAKDEPKPKEALPADLALVPHDAVGFQCIRLADLWGHDGMKDVRAQIAKENPDFAKRIDKTIAVAPADVARLTGVLLEGPREGPQRSAVIIATSRPYDLKTVLAFMPQTKEEKHGDKTCYVYEGTALCPVDKTTFVVGNAEAVATVMDRAGKNAGGPLAPALAEAAAKHTFALGFRPAAAMTALGVELPAEAKPFKPLIEARAGGATLDLGKVTHAEVRLHYGRASEAKDAALVAQGLLVLARRSLPLLQQTLDKEEESQTVQKLLTELGVGLKAAPIEAKGTTVSMSVTVKVDVETFAKATAEGVAAVRGAANRLTSGNNLKQMTLAMHEKADNDGTLPADAIYSKDGKPLLSWRVAILPYIEANDLYKDFHLDEPWDSDHNKKLISKMPKVYVDPAAGPVEGKTHYRVFHGPGAAFEGKTGLRIPASFVDGVSNTILIVEAEEAVTWTKPDELPFDAKKDLPRLGIKGSKYFQVVFADGTVRRFKKTIDPEVLKALITPAGGEKVEIPKD